MGGTGCSAQVSAVIARYAPRSLTPAAAASVRVMVAAAQPATPVRAKALLFAAAKLAGFAESVGLELDAGVLLCGATVERFILVGCPGVSPATLRTNLRALARSQQPLPGAGRGAAGARAREAAYSPGEVDAYLRLAAAQSTRRAGCEPARWCAWARGRA